MQVSETLNEGLKREIKVVVPKADLQSKLGERLEDAKDKVQLKGFRPGKVPVAHLRKMYGKSLMAEIVNEILNETPRSVLSDRGEKSADAAGNRHERGREGSRKGSGRRCRLRILDQVRSHPADRAEGFLLHQDHPRGRRHS
jgi:FKBP-type peptidyl-prolyl cis-trans isomerase (trigger factor)